MSKNKDIEKTLIEKRKDFKIEKLEKEHKEPWKEKIEHKEFKELKQEIKEKPERKEFKEPIKEKVEHKEFKELEKQVPEKGGKEIVEGGFDPGEIFQQRGDTADTAGDVSGATAAKAVEKQLEKVQKDLEKIKPEKEHIKHEIKELKNEKIERKELKFEKLEIKEQKLEIIEKHHHKDILADKHVFENDPKGIVENPGSGIPGIDPATRGPVFKAEGPPEERLTQLEEAVTKLAHFIGADLRPDLSTGALKSEPDVAGAKTDEPKADDKNKKR
jgi:hypothetical protein